MKSKILLALSIAAVLFSGCKKEEDKNTNTTPTQHPLKNYIGTYTVSYHERTETPGVPYPHNICDTTYIMQIRLDTLASDTIRMQFTLDTSKLSCQSDYYEHWCFAAPIFQGELIGSDFKEWCDGSSGHVTVTASTLTINGSAIDGSVAYTEWVLGQLYIPAYFEFHGTKN